MSTRRQFLSQRAKEAACLLGVWPFVRRTIHHHPGPIIVPLPGGLGFPDPPLPPSESNYTIPGGFTTVTDGPTLATALASGTPHDIKLLNGTYTTAGGGAFLTNTPHRLYGESVAGVVLTCGIDFRQSGAFKCKGMTFQLPDAAHGLMSDGFTSAAIDNFDGAGAEVTDIIADGNQLCTAAVYMRGSDATTVKRIVATHFTDFGVLLYDNNQLSTKVITDISDINASGIWHVTNGVIDWRGKSNGGGEMALMCGHKVTNGVRRIKARDCGCLGILSTGSCNNTLFTDMDCDSCWGHDAGGPSTTLASTGIYIEHFTRSCTFQRFLLGGDTGDLEVGFASEYDNEQNAAVSGSITLPLATIPTLANSNPLTAGFPGGGGTLFVGEFSPTTVTYGGISGLNFTGCSGGTGTFPNGTLISLDTAGVGSGGNQAGSDNTYQTGYIRCLSTRTPQPADKRRGLVFGQGTRRPTVTGVTFVGQDGAAFDDWTNTPRCSGAGNSMLVQSGNDFSGMVGGTPISIYH